MQPRLLVIFLVVYFFITPSAIAETKPQYDFYGFVRIDAIFDDSRVQNHQYAFWALSEDPAFGPENDSHFVTHPRVTRFGVKLRPHALSETASIRGVIEVDFQNGGSESRERLRMRLAYFEVERGGWSFLGGQTWDAIAPLYPGVHTDGILWNAGNLGDRHPQLRGAYAGRSGGGKYEGVVAVGLTGAVDGKDVDGNGLRDGEDAGLPFVQGRIGGSRAVWGGKDLSGGVWGHYAEEQVQDPIESRSTCYSKLVGFDASVPLFARVKLEGEGWLGQNLSDVRGGIGQGVNTCNGGEIESRGGWVQLAVRPEGKWSVFTGASVDDPDDEDVVSLEDVEALDLTLADVGRTLNQVAFVSTRYRPWKPFQIGLEYLYWVTEYNGLERGTDNRVNLHFSYFF